MSSLAAQQVPALLAAMRSGHERAAGEWQIEWDALPTVVALTAGCLANTRDILSGLSVFPDRMRTNPGIDGGTIMAERAMIRLAIQVGRAVAHDLVYEACSVARHAGIGFGDALVRTLEPHLLKELGPLDELLDPGSYLGEAPAVVDAALEIWKTAKARQAEAGGMAT
jgi:3-carboxy-cis,cis-muconate cycloisomerase